LKITDKLYFEGTLVRYYPFKIYYLKVDDKSTDTSVVISVPKKLHKKAVTRNLIRRRIRESIRSQKINPEIFKSKHLMIIYSTNKVEKYGNICKSIEILFNKIYN